MAENKTSFVFYESYFESMSGINTKKNKLLMYETICKYGLYGIEPNNLPQQLQGNFALIRPTIDAAQKRRKTSVSNGSKGGAPKGNQNARKQPKNNLNVNGDVNVNRDVNGDVDSIADKPPRNRFIPPSVEEVREYCQSRNNSVDPQRFVDYYTSNGWKVGRNKMKDWKAAVHTWENNEYNRTEGTNGKNKRDDQETGWELPGVTRF